MQYHEAILKTYNLEILQYIKKEEPSTSEVLFFIGTMLHSLLDDIKLTAKEKTIYLDIYNTIIRKKIYEAEIVKEPVLAMV